MQMQRVTTILRVYSSSKRKATAWCLSVCLPVRLSCLAYIQTAWLARRQNRAEADSACAVPSIREPIQLLWYEKCGLLPTILTWSRELVSRSQIWILRGDTENTETTNRIGLPRWIRRFWCGEEIWFGRVPQWTPTERWRSQENWRRYDKFGPSTTPCCPLLPIQPSAVSMCRIMRLALSIKKL